jgi:ParB/RepB/Spo0J family partition protein
MAKLQTPNTAGFNAAGNGYNVKLVKIDDIVIDPEIASIFTVSDKNKNKIVEKMKKHGFYKEEPVTLWRDKETGRLILIDGRTRYTAAIEAGLKEIPAVERDFESPEDAIMYTFERQVIRRNLTGEEILTAVQLTINGRKEKNDGTGRLGDQLAERLGISPATIYQARAILKDAPPEVLEAVKKGKTSMKKGYNETKQRQRPEKAFIVNDSQGLPGNIAFLKSAVILLVEKSKLENGAEIGAAILLINHFLKKNEKQGFYDLLPKAISKKLPRLPLLAGRAK